MGVVVGTWPVLGPAGAGQRDSVPLVRGGQGGGWEGSWDPSEDCGERWGWALGASWVLFSLPPTFSREQADPDSEHPRGFRALPVPGARPGVLAQSPHPREVGPRVLKSEETKA